MKRFIPLILFMALHAGEAPTLTVIVDTTTIDPEGLCQLALECCFGDQAPFYSQLIPYVHRQLELMPNDEGVHALHQYQTMRRTTPPSNTPPAACASPHAEKICAIVSRAFDEAIAAKDKEIEQIKKEAEEKAKQTRCAIAANLATAIITGMFTWLASTSGGKE